MKQVIVFRIDTEANAYSVDFGGLLDDWQLNEAALAVTAFIAAANELKPIIKAPIDDAPVIAELIKAKVRRT